MASDNIVQAGRKTQARSNSMRWLREVATLNMWQSHFQRFVVEGWHRRFNKKNADQTPPFYQLVEKLFDEACLLLVQRMDQ